MGSALPGSHYCKNHQGNGSHYSTQNCHLCYALARIDELLEKINAAPLTPIVADKGSVQYGNGQSGAAPDLREFRKASLSEALEVMRARLSEHLSPAEKRELEQAAALLAQPAAAGVSEERRKLMPLEPTKYMKTEGGRRLLSFQDGSTDESFSALQWSAVRNEAERVWRSMWLAVRDEGEKT